MNTWQLQIVQFVFHIIHIYDIIQQGNQMTFSAEVIISKSTNNELLHRRIPQVSVDSWLVSVAVKPIVHQPNSKKLVRALQVKKLRQT